MTVEVVVWEKEYERGIRCDASTAYGASPALSSTGRRKALRTRSFFVRNTRVQDSIYASVSLVVQRGIINLSRRPSLQSLIFSRRSSAIESHASQAQGLVRACVVRLSVWVPSTKRAARDTASEVGMSHRIWCHRVSMRHARGEHLSMGNSHGPVMKNLIDNGHQQCLP